MLRDVSFTNPEFLWLSPLALFVAWWWRRRARPALRFSDVSGFARAAAGVPRSRSGAGRRSAGWRACA